MFGHLRGCIRLARCACSNLLGTCTLEAASKMALHPLQSLAQFTRGVKKQANEVRPGHVLEVDGKLFVVSKSTHTQGAGRQLGNVQMTLKDLMSQTKHTERKRPYDMVEVVRLEERKFQCLYQEGDILHLMDPESFNQVALESAVFADQQQFLQEGMELTLSFHNGTPVTGELPQQAVFRVAETAPYVKGDSASASYKAASMDTGLKVMVPAFVQPGDSIVVDTRDGTFVKRAN